MKITLQELRYAFNEIIDHIEKYNTSYELDCDYYWDIREKDKYDMSKLPTELIAGQLSSDLDDISAINTKHREALEIDLIPFSAIIRAIGEGKGKKR